MMLNTKQLKETISKLKIDWMNLGNGEFIEIANNTRKPVKAGLRVSGDIPYYGANNIQDYVEGFTHHGEYILIAEDGSKSLDKYSIQYVNGKFWANNHVHVVRGINKVNTKFLYYYLTTFNFIPYLSGGERAKLTKAKLINIEFPIIDLEIQNEIVRILDAFTELTAELTAELNLRKNQYNYYRDKLLSFEEDEVEWKTLKDVALEFGRGKSKHRPRNDPNLYGGNIPFIQTGDIRNASHTIEKYSQTYSQFGLNQSKLWPKGTLCITIAANIAETAILGFDSCFPDSIIGFVADTKKCNVDYVEYLLSSWKTKLQAKSTGSAQENINLSTFETLLLPFPSLNKQENIVNLLRSFELLTNSITDGLPREIELRQKQYEYYQDMLLNFPKPTHSL